MKYHQGAAERVNWKILTRVSAGELQGFKHDFVYLLPRTRGGQKLIIKFWWARNNQSRTQ